MKEIPGTNYFAEYSETVNIALTNEFGFAVFGDCIGNPNIVAVEPMIFWVGCIMVRNDIVSGNNIYINNGNTVSPNWELLNPAGAGSSLHRETPDGPVNDSNVTFAVQHEPFFINVNGAIYSLGEGAYQSYASRTITLAYPVGMGGFISSFYQQ